MFPFPSKNSNLPIHIAKMEQILVSKWSSCHHIDPLPPTACHFFRLKLKSRSSQGSLEKLFFFESHGGSCGGHACPKRAKTPCIWGNQTQTVVMKHHITNISLTFIDSLLIQIITFMSSLTWMQTCNLTGKFDTLAIKFTTSASAAITPDPHPYVRRAFVRKTVLRWFRWMAWLQATGQVGHACSWGVVASLLRRWPKDTSKSLSVHSCQENLAPCLRNHWKTMVSSVYLCLFPWESFSRHTIFISTLQNWINQFGWKQGCCPL